VACITCAREISAYHLAGYPCLYHFLLHSSLSFSSSFFLSPLYLSRTHFDLEPGHLLDSDQARLAAAGDREAGDRHQRYLGGPRRSKLGRRRPAAARARESGDRDIGGQRRRDLAGLRRRYLGVLAGARRLGRPATGRDASSGDRPAAAQAANWAGDRPAEGCGMLTSGKLAAAALPAQRGGSGGRGLDVT
jgi:hypothetical protein